MPKLTQTAIDTWFREMDEMDKLRDLSFMKEGRKQPKMPVRIVF